MKTSSSRSLILLIIIGYLSDVTISAITDNPVKEESRHSSNLECSILESFIEPKEFLEQIVETMSDSEINLPNAQLRKATKQTNLMHSFCNPTKKTCEITKDVRYELEISNDPNEHEHSYHWLKFMEKSREKLATYVNQKESIENIGCQLKGK